MFERKRISLWVAIWLAAVGRAVADAPPRATSERYHLELIADEPTIVTPIGLAFDRHGRLLIVESHTHDRSDSYDGRAADRIRMLTDTDGDGRLDRWSTFADGLRHAMNLLVRPDGAVYVVTKNNVLLLRDADDDGVADRRRELLRLETKAFNPHNCLNGIARDPRQGRLLIGLGQTRTFPYRLIDSQGNELSSTDGAGAIFELSESGGRVARVATGFWNPFSICALPNGRIFAVDNDPDDSPPCRLLHVVAGGDYGYRYQYARGGTHPLQAWNGELPGTLPMICGTGEAPTAIVPHAGSLWITSWGDHRIERYDLFPRGSSYGARREVVVQGGVNFRPTGMAAAPDGSLYFADWVLRDYPVHGRGRIWRLALPTDDITDFPEIAKEDVGSLDDTGKAVDNVESSDPFVHAQRVWKLSQQRDWNHEASLNPRLRLSLLEAERLRGSDHPEAILRAAVRDESADVRLFAVRWIADERLSALRDEVAGLLEGPQPNPRYYLAVLGALDWLDHEPGLRSAGISDELLVRELRNAERSPRMHALALQMLSPDNKFLTLGRLREYLEARYLPLRVEAVRSLAQQSNPERFALLALVAGDEAQSVEVRAEAIVGLAADAKMHRRLLEELAAGEEKVVPDEAQRVLRLAGLRSAPAEAKPPADDLAAWEQLLETAGNAISGRRLFFSHVGPRCGSCHQHGGRGDRIGPDLTGIARSSKRERIVASILRPNEEIAPDYQPWILTTADGKTHTGLRIPKPGHDGIEIYADAEGRLFSLPRESIEIRTTSSTSIMPEGLQNSLTIADLRDLLTFLTTTLSE